MVIMSAKRDASPRRELPNMDSLKKMTRRDLNNLAYALKIDISDFTHKSAVVNKVIDKVRKRTKRRRYGDTKIKQIKVTLKQNAGHYFRLIHHDVQATDTVNALKVVLRNCEENVPDDMSFLVCERDWTIRHLRYPDGTFESNGFRDKVTLLIVDNASTTGPLPTSFSVCSVRSDVESYATTSDQDCMCGSDSD